jgi:succinate-acetate transporter protein
MARYPTRDEAATSREEVPVVANPVPLGLSVLAFTTAVLGAYFAGFIVPYNTTGSRLAVGAILAVGGLIELLAGMWEFRRNDTVAATVFSSYGGFLAAIGLVLLLGLIVGGIIHLALGLFFLAWTIFLGVIMLAALRGVHFLTPTLGLLFAFSLIVTIGLLAFDNRVLLIIGGWVGIVAALMAWAAVLVQMTGAHSLRESLRGPAHTR